MALDVNTISIIAFYAALILLIFLNRHKITRQGPLLLYHSKRGIKTMDKLAKRFKKFWHYWSLVGIPIMFAASAFIFGFLAYNIYKFITIPGTAGGVALALPGVRIPGSPIFLPFWYGVISLILVLVVHEGAHGVIARVRNLKIKSTGVGLLIAIPLAFVEPDEKKLSKAPYRDQLSILAAGPFSNLCTAGLLILIGSFLLVPATIQAISPEGVEIVGVVEGFPADLAGLKSEDLIVGINGQSIRTIGNLTEIFESSQPGDILTFETVDGQFIEVMTIEDPQNSSKAHIGIQFTQSIEYKKGAFGTIGPRILFMLTNLFNWAIALNLGIGAINMLPLSIMDGGRMFELALQKHVKNKQTRKTVWLTVSLIASFLLILNIVGPYIF